MDWIVGLLLLVVGTIVGFFVAKFVFDKKLAEQESKSNENSLKDILVNNAAGHLSQTREIVDALQTKCGNLSEQLDAYENMLMASQANRDGDEKLSYFGEDAAMYIRNSQAKQKRKPSDSEFQPRDFSSESSGLFDGSNNEKVVGKSEL